MRRLALERAKAIAARLPNAAATAKDRRGLSGGEITFGRARNFNAAEVIMRAREVLSRSEEEIEGRLRLAWGL